MNGERRRDAAAGAIDVEADPLGAVLVLEEEELHHRQVGHGVVDHPLQEDDPVFQEQIAQGHLPLPRIVAVTLERRLGERVFEMHRESLRDHGPGRRNEVRSDTPEPGLAWLGGVSSLK